MTKIKQNKVFINDIKTYKITKVGKSSSPYNPYSDYGDLAPYYIGLFLEPPKVGKSFHLSGYYSNDPKTQGIITSIVTKIISEDTFETMNSIYKIEPYENKT